MFAVRIFAFFALAVTIVRGQKANNVCPSYQDYATIGTNERCWYNPDVNSKPETIARRNGFRLESHKITTSDGYILNMYRVVLLNGTIGDTPILLQHGFSVSAAFWLLHGKTSLPFYLASVGYDVWMSNVRGTEVSMRHMTMSPVDPEFWNFSFHEIAVLDVPAQLDYIRNKTGGKRKVTFIGHSMGGTVQFVYASMMPDHAKENVNAIISLAPVVYMKYMKTEVPKIFARYTELILQQSAMIDFHGTGVYPHLKKNVGNTCSRHPYISICQKILETLFGSSLENFEPETLPLFFRRYPASFSIKTIAHFGQVHFSGGRFQMYDYGPRGNLLRYNSVAPPEYDVQKIKVPVYIIFGEADLISVEKDNMLLFSGLKTEKYIVPFRGANNTKLFTHENFLFSKSMMDYDRYLTELVRNISSRDDKYR